ETDLPHDAGEESMVSDGTVQPARQLVVTEERFSGAVEPEAYRRYLALFAPGIVLVLLGLVFVVKELLNAGSDGWLAWWSTAGSFEPVSFVIGFALLGLGACIAIFIRSLVISLQGLSAGRKLHDGLLRSVLRAPMSFFEENPV